MCCKIIVGFFIEETNYHYEAFAIRMETHFATVKHFVHSKHTSISRFNYLLGLIPKKCAISHITKHLSISFIVEPRTQLPMFEWSFCTKCTGAIFISHENT